jgi:hypothetical protein
MDIILTLLFFICIFVVGYLVKSGSPKTIHTLNSANKAIRSLKASYLAFFVRPLSHKRGKWFLIGLMGICYVSIIIYVFSK